MTTVAQYLARLAPDRRAAIAKVRAVVNARLPRGYEETIQSGMISWVVPAGKLSHTYNGQPLPLASLASQKRHMALYLMCVYGDPAAEKALRARFAAAGKKLDMGKSCVRFSDVEQLALDAIGDAIAGAPIDAYVAQYERNRSKAVKQKPVAPSGAKVAKAAKSPKRG